MTARAVLAAVVVMVGVAVTAGCTSSKPSGDDLERLRLAAHLDPCPTTDASAPSADHGLPDLTFDCLGDGPKVPLADLRGSPVLVNVWGSWCGPCQREVPALQRVHTEAKDRVLVLGVDTEDSDASALDFAAHADMTYPSVVDESGTFHRALGRSTVPMTLFVNSEGEVVHTSYGQFHGADDIRTQVARYLGVHL